MGKKDGKDGEEKAPKEAKLLQEPGYGYGYFDYGKDGKDGKKKDGKDGEEKAPKEAKLLQEPGYGYGYGDACRDACEAVPEDAFSKVCGSEGQLCDERMDSAEDPEAAFESIGDDLKLAAPDAAD